jgi:cytochrome P450
MCIGEPFAKLEGVLALATLARIWALKAIETIPAGLGNGFLLNSDKPVLMRLTKQKPSNSQIYVSRVTTAT